MVLPIKFSPEIKQHIEAGHFTVYPKPWMGGKRIWIWTKGTEVVGGVAPTQREAEEAAKAWYDKTA